MEEEEIWGSPKRSRFGGTFCATTAMGGSASRGPSRNNSMIVNNKSPHTNPLTQAMSNISHLVALLE